MWLMEKIKNNDYFGKLYEDEGIRA